MVMKISTINRQQPSHSASRQSGFSVIEMLIGITVFTIVMGAVYGLLQLGRASRLNTNMRAEALQNARIALNTLGRDIINSGVGYPNIGAMIPDDRVTGLFGGTADADTNPDFLTPLYTRNNAIAVNGVMTDTLTVAFVDNAFNNGVSIPISAITASGANLTVQSGFTNTPCNIGDIYLISGQTSAAALGILINKASTDKLIFSSGAADPLDINQPGVNSAINLISLPASLQRVRLVQYYLTDEDGTASGSGTLMRNEYGGATGWSAQPLAYGVENFQCQYIMKDGAILDQPAAAQMQNIRQVRLSLTVRSPDIDPRTKQPFRETITATVSARNLEYEKF
jgi:prepilin-type N-terminal cleavage/methylation domain-containing protein